MPPQWGKKGLDMGPIRLVLRGKEAARTGFEKKSGLFCQRSSYFVLCYCIVFFSTCFIVVCSLWILS